MRGRIVKCERAIEMCPPLRYIPGMLQGKTHDAMPDHERDGRPLFLGERQELRCKLAVHIATQYPDAPDPNAEECREQQQRVFGRLSQRTNRGMPSVRSMMSCRRSNGNGLLLAMQSIMTP